MSGHDINEAIKYLEQFQFHGFRLGLERMEAILSALGNPHLSYPVIHVAGSNGKGSTCAAIHSILTEAGYRSGFYSSPHLFRLNERFMMGRGLISDEELAKWIFRIKELVEAGYELSYFEYTTAVALAWFSEKEADIAILETGLGGRLDATNIIPSPLVSVITTVSLEHQHWLGSTIKEIAWEKAGIIKPGSPVVSTVLDEEAAGVIEKRAKQLNSPLYRIGREFSVSSNGEDGRFGFTFGERRIDGLRFALSGRHQLMNAAAACASAMLLNEKGLKVEDGAIMAGLKRASWPCRCELLPPSDPNMPRVLLDGAHNLEGITALKDFLERLLAQKSFKNRVLLWACSNEGGDKPFLELLGQVSPLFQHVIITEPPGPRVPVKAEQWRRALNQAGGLENDSQAALDIEPAWMDALKKGLCLAGPEGLLVTAGSLYLAGAVRESLMKKANPIQK